MNCIHPITVWLTGLPAAGKTTLGVGLKHRLQAQGLPVVLLDGDAVRNTLCSDLGFSHSDRTENIRRVASVAELLNNQGFIAVCCFVSPLQTMRQLARDIIGPTRFFEVYVDAPLDICLQRDVKGNYQKAIQGTLSNFTGISDSYEPPSQPNLRINTAKLDAEKSLDLLYINVLQWVENNR